MFVIIETGGKQYQVSPGDKLKVEKLPDGEGSVVRIDKVLLKSDEGNVQVGQPYLNGSSVEAKVLSEGRDKKKIVFHYRPKTRYRKKKGHRQHYTELEISKIV